MWFTKKVESKVMTAVDKINESVKNEEPTVEPEPKVEEWIWITGYKGTAHDMRCRDYQYALGEVYTMPEDAEIIECTSGFHLCKNLDDVFTYYDIGNNNRFFEVHALVRKEDYERYGKYTKEYEESLKKGGIINYFLSHNPIVDKLVAKSIIFKRELTPDEIFDVRTDCGGWTDEDKRLALSIGIDGALNTVRVRTLVELGFSQTFAHLIIDSDKYDTAVSVASQPDLRMDMKCWLIFK